MIIVISCAGSKRKGAGKLKTKDGTPVKFVAHPEIAPRGQGIVYQHPDSESDFGGSWRKMLKEYNNDLNASPLGTLGLFKAWELYRPQRKAYREIYDDLANTFGEENVYILSAGWGLIRSDFLTPNYDITFTNVKKDKKWKQRKYGEGEFLDFNQLSQPPAEIKGPIVFMGGQSYVDFFIALTEDLKTEKVVYFYSEDIKTDYLEYSSEYDLRVYPNSDKEQRTWHYQCAKDLIDGKIQI